MTEPMTLEQAMRRAFSLGQTYWQQADSESYAQNKKADQTAQRFNDLLRATLSAHLAQQAQPVDVARRFHEAYERLAPSFGYETRHDTRAFDPDSPNGKLMTAVCAEVTGASPTPDKLRAHGHSGRELPNWDFCDAMADAIDAHLVQSSLKIKAYPLWLAQDLVMRMTVMTSSMPSVHS